EAPPPVAGDTARLAGMVPRRGGPLLTDPAALPSWITESDVDVYVRGFTHSGFRGPLAWYPDVDRRWELMAAFNGKAVTVPALYIAGDRDFLVPTFQQFIAKQSALVPRLRPAIMLPGCGHWTQQERAPEVSAAMIEFIRQL